MNQELLLQKIKTTNDLYGIVQTMKMLSSASVGQYEKALISLNQYKENIQLGFQGLFAQDFFSYPNLSHPKSSNKILAIIIGSDNGLVGKFNRELIHFFHQESQQSTTKIIAVGKRIAMALTNEHITLGASYSNSNSTKEISSLADTLLNKVNQILSKESFDSVYLFYNKKKENTFVCKKRQLLPFPQDLLDLIKKKTWTGRMIPLIHSDNQGLFSSLSQEYLIVFLLQGLTHSLACEHYIRMLHMQQAEKNIEKRLEELNLIYQQERQNQITNELIDIVSGAEAMKPNLTKK